MAAPLLEARDVSKRFGGVAALRHAQFSLRPGEVHALIGENGAGKSTLAKILAGSVKPDAGRILIDGQPAAIASPLDAQRLGIGIIYQELDLFPHLTVGENIVIGNLCFPEGRLTSPRNVDAFCRPFLEQAGLECGARRMAGSLSIGERQLLAIARALSMNARAILMDEPTSSLFDDAAERLFGLIRELKDRGVSIVYVSHKMDEIFRVCDRATVLRDGETVETVEVAATNAGEIIRLMVGRNLQIAARPYRRPLGEVVLEAHGLTSGKLKDVSFQLHRSEVLGVAGLVGSGRSELGAALFGLDRIRAGAIHLRGSPLQPASPRDAIRRGIGLLPEDRRLEGLMMRMSVIENSTLAVLARMQKLGFIRRRQEISALGPVVRQLALNCPSLASPAASLSGGNQQKVLLARWLLLDPDVFFLDDPTRGIDVGAKQDIYRIIDGLAAAGKGVMLVSSELPDLLRCCDRILVLSNGRLTAVYDAKEATQETIMASATSFGPHMRKPVKDAP
ncbi:fused D-ribose transporter subunits of ABC superfamily: ATP-binding components [Candidatus Sulfopaludibacter sp. SbA4]|nr:fused D-ribose transporter subunits of ABC superfamily: ATP-binding components [Candidatus Sulfopaludibacter sp. SbA4]